MMNKPKMKKEKKKKTKKSCKNKNNNNNNNNNGNNNGYIIKIEEESSIERQTHENSELKEEIDNHSEIKASNDQSYNSQRFPQNYEEYLDNNERSSTNLSLKSTNILERQTSKDKNCCQSKKIISNKYSKSFFYPNKMENLLFPKVKSQYIDFDLRQIIEMERNIKEYDIKEIELEIENVYIPNPNMSSLLLDDVNNKFAKMKSKSNAKNNNFNNYIFERSESYDSCTKNLFLVGKKRKKKFKYYSYITI